MGSLFSPSVPTYTPTYVPQGRASSSQDSKESETVTADKSVEEDSVKDVIKRASRGRNSTIQTSYRGVLSDMNALVPQRKNLLGE